MIRSLDLNTRRSGNDRNARLTSMWSVPIVTGGRPPASRHAPTST